MPPPNDYCQRGRDGREERGRGVCHTHRTHCVLKRTRSLHSHCLRASLVNYCNSLIVVVRVIVVVELVAVVVIFVFVFFVVTACSFNRVPAIESTYIPCKGAVRQAGSNRSQNHCLNYRVYASRAISKLFAALPNPINILCSLVTHEQSYQPRRLVAIDYGI